MHSEACRLISTESQIRHTCSSILNFFIFFLFFLLIYSLFSFLDFFFFETGAPFIMQAGLEFAYIAWAGIKSVLLPQPPKCCDDRCAPLRSAPVLIFNPCSCLLFSYLSIYKIFTYSDVIFPSYRLLRPKEFSYT